MLNFLNLCQHHTHEHKHTIMIVPDSGVLCILTVTIINTHKYPTMNLCCTSHLLLISSQDFWQNHIIYKYHIIINLYININDLYLSGCTFKVQNSRNSAYSIVYPYTNVPVKYKTSHTSTKIQSKLHFISHCGTAC